MIRLSDFAGQWHLSRTIIDQKAGNTAMFEGTAQFSQTAAGLDYTETGTLHVDGQQPLKAERAYRWRAEGALIAIDFADGRAFHSFDPNAPEASHWCDPDRYDVTYSFSDWPDWRASWLVSGPRKLYRMVSHYSPLQR